MMCKLLLDLLPKALLAGMAVGVLLATGACDLAPPQPPAKQPTGTPPEQPAEPPIEQAPEPKPPPAQPTEPPTPTVSTPAPPAQLSAASRPAAEQPLQSFPAPNPAEPAASQVAAQQPIDSPPAAAFAQAPAPAAQPASPAGGAASPGNLARDPSFESTQARDRWGYVFTEWKGWKYEGECEFRVGQVARTGKTSCLLFGGTAPKIRVAQNQELEPGRYRITAYLRGLDIGVGQWNATTEFMFDGKYFQLEKNGTFGWTKLTYVGQLSEKKEAGPSFGLWAPGYLWIDDVVMQRVGDEVPLTEKPILDEEEAPIAPPGPLGPGAVRCPECAYQNMPEWKACYACGTRLEARPSEAVGPALRVIASFEDENPFGRGTVVAAHATQGSKSLRVDRSYVSMERAQDWTGYDFLKADVYADAKEPVELYVEIRDRETTGYWTRVNYQTVVPPGQSTLVIPIQQLYVGEKSRPGRPLLTSGITRLVFNLGEDPAGPVFLDHIRLERDQTTQQMVFEGLYAFDFGTANSPVMDGFTPITAATRYHPGRGYGLKDARTWRSYDVLQPEPLYQDFLCIEQGGLAVDLPNGTYRVFVNLDNPSGYWGEYQVFRRRAILAEGKPVAVDTMDFEKFKSKYFRFWNVEDMPGDDTFEKYQQTYYAEKTFDVEVTDGQLNLEFQGENWGCSVSAVVIFPVAKATEGEKFLRFVEDRRRFYFDNYFKRILHQPTGDLLAPSPADAARAYLIFRRDYMQDVHSRPRPLRANWNR